MGLDLSGLLPLIEVPVKEAVKKLINAESDAGVDALFALLEKASPSWLAALEESEKPAVEAAVKAFLLQLADKI